MFVLGLKKTQVWLEMILLLLRFSIWPTSCYPYVQVDESSAAAVDVDNEENQEPVQDVDEEEEYGDPVEDIVGVEDGPTDAPACIEQGKPCVKNSGSKCCGSYNFICKEYDGKPSVCMVDWSALQ